jgi:phosphoglycolate phosphatase-like HAD superfamily hydrolase
MCRDVKRAGFPVADASNCIRETVLSLLRALGLLDVVDAVFCNEDVQVSSRYRLNLQPCMSPPGPLRHDLAT